MGMTGAMFAQHAHDIAERDRTRNQGLEDEKRHLDEQSIQDDPDMSPQQKFHDINVKFAHEPVESRTGRFGRWMERRVGMKGRADAGQQAADTKLQEQRDNLYGVPPAPSQGQPAPQSNPSGDMGAALNTYPNPEDQPADVSLKFNQPWSSPDWQSKMTKLSPEDEAKFQEWAKQNPKSVQGEMDPDTADYDVRGHWAAAQRGDPAASLKLNAWDGKLHGNDKFKTPRNGGFSNESMYATPDAPRWQGDRLVTKDGRLVTDETPKAAPASKGPAPRAQLPQPNPGYRNRNEAIAGSLSNKTPQQQAQEAAEAKRGNIAPDLQANVDAIGTVLKRAGVDPAIIKEAQAIAGGAPAGAFKPESANWGNSQDIKLADGRTVSAQKNSRTGEWAYLSGEPIPKNLLSGATAVRTPHPLSPASQYANLMAKRLLADRKQGPPLTNEENAQLAGVRDALTLGGISTANARADAMARNGLVLTTDPDTGMEVETQRSQAVAASRGGHPMTAGAVGAPTTQDKEKQMYAVSSLHRLKEMRNIVKSHPEVFGPIGGRTTNASVWLGSQSPEAQKFKQDAQFLAEHSTAVFGGRAASTVEALQKIQSDPKTNPEALLAGFDTDEDTLKDFTTGGGRLPAPRAQGGASMKFVDGGKQYQIPSAKVEAFKKAHPNAKPE